MFRSQATKSIEHTIESSGDSAIVIRLGKAVWRHERLGQVEALDPQPGQGLVIVDLSQVQEMTTAGFAQLLVMKTRLAAKGCRMMVQGLQRQPSLLCRLLRELL